MKHSGTLYLDYATWGPNAHRLIRKMRLAGQYLGPDGRWRSVELMGPPSIDVWDLCDGVAETAFIMLDAIDLGNILVCRAKIKACHDR